MPCLWPEVPPNLVVPEADVPCCSTCGYVFLSPEAFLPVAGARIKETLAFLNIPELKLQSLSSGILGRTKVPSTRDAASGGVASEVVVDKQKDAKQVALLPDAVVSGCGLLLPSGCHGGDQRRADQGCNCVP